MLVIQEKACSSCKETKSVDQFYNEAKTKTGKASRCIPCNKQHLKKYRSQHRERLNNNHKQFMQERAEALRKIIKQFKEENPCVRCGFTDHRALQCHHRNPEDKQFNIGHAIHKSVKDASLLAELAKCDVMCANCHAIHHAEERGYFASNS